VAGHKFYAPKGVGALYIREGRKLPPLLHGAGQEHGRRAGTENVLLLAGLGAAAGLARERLEADGVHLKTLRDRLHERLLEGFPQLVLNGPESQRLPNTLNVSFPGLQGSAILAGLPEVAASVGSACHAGEETHSPVLVAMGVPAAVARGAVRLSVGRPTTREEVERAAEMILGRVKELGGGPGGDAS
jgi:cysteine desulfurase